MERGRTGKQGVLNLSQRAWRRLLGESGKTPWELTPADFEQHAAWMLGQGYAPGTTRNALCVFSKFYRWCSLRQIDPQCGAGFNPAARVRWPAQHPYQDAHLLSRGEVDRLLSAMRRDRSALGRRDYAYTLARLHLGAPHRALRELKWGQIEPEADGAWLRWRPETERSRLPDEVWQAIREALQAGGRLDGMRLEDHIFAGLVDPFKDGAGEHAGDWAAGRPFSVTLMLKSLKRYGRLAGIPEAKLTQEVLRHTAIRLKQAEGASLNELWLFNGGRAGKASFKFRLGYLPELPADQSGAGHIGADHIGNLGVPGHQPRRYKPGEGTKHGLYTRRHPREEVEALLAEDIQGIEEQIVGLRTLARRLLERQEQTPDSREAARLLDAYNLAASRLGELIKAGGALESGGKSSQWAENFLAVSDEIAAEMGIEPVSDGLRSEAAGGGGPAGMASGTGLSAGARQPAEEIAAMRYVLRNVYRLGIEAQETGEIIHMVEVYGLGCIRLMRLLKMEQAGAGNLEAFLRAEIDRAIHAVNIEMGLIPPD